MLLVIFLKIEKTTASKWLLKQNSFLCPFYCYFIFIDGIHNLYTPFSCMPPHGGYTLNMWEVRVIKKGGGR